MLELGLFGRLPDAVTAATGQGGRPSGPIAADAAASAFGDALAALSLADAAPDTDETSAFDPLASLEGLGDLAIEDSEGSGQDEAALAMAAAIASSLMLHVEPPTPPPAPDVEEIVESSIDGEPAADAERSVTAPSPDAALGAPAPVAPSTAGPRAETRDQASHASRFPAESPANGPVQEASPEASAMTSEQTPAEGASDDRTVPARTSPRDAAALSDVGLRERRTAPVRRGVRTSVDAAPEALSAASAASIPAAPAPEAAGRVSDRKPSAVDRLRALFEGASVDAERAPEAGTAKMPAAPSSPAAAQENSSAAFARDVVPTPVAHVATRHEPVAPPSQDAHDPASSGSALHVAAGPKLMLTPSVPVTSLGGLVDAPAASLPSGTADQIVQALRLQLTRDGGEAHIKLDPQQFGDVSVRVRVEQGQVVARVEAEAAVVREWLQANQHVLRQSLAGQQLTLDRLEVNAPRESADADRERQPSRRDEQPHQRQPQRRRNSSSELFDVVA